MTSEPSSPIQNIINQNWQRVCLQVDHACQAVGRDGSSVKIVGVTKYVGAELIAPLIEAGCRTIGENRPQSLWQKREWLEIHKKETAGSTQWHLIGHLQRNKVRRTLPLVDAIQSVDSLRLAREVSQQAEELGLCVQVLLDVNLTQDSTKTGFLPEQLRRDLGELIQLPGIDVRGLMAMSTLDASTSQVRSDFCRVRQFRDELVTRAGGEISLSELSMGMSGDFAEAIAEGSTCVRIGSHLWTGIGTTP